MEDYEITIQKRQERGWTREGWNAICNPKVTTNKTSTSKTEWFPLL